MEENLLDVCVQIMKKWEQKQVWHLYCVQSIPPSNRILTQTRIQEVWKTGNKLLSDFEEHNVKIVVH